MDTQHHHFLKLLKPIESSVQAYVKHLAWSRNDIEDIFQTALLNAYKKFDTYQEGTNFKAWFFRFLTYTAYNANRRHEKISLYEVLTDSQEIPEPVFNESMDNPLHYEKFLKDPDSILESIEQEIGEAIRRLAVRRRSIFLLKAIGNLSYTEIAHILDIPIGTVMGELYRAREQLRKELSGYVRKFRVLKKEGDSNGV